MTKKSTSRGVIKDIAIVIIGVAILFVALQIIFGIGSNPFYVVASGSMVPELQKHDIIIVQGNIPFEDIEIGDIIVFDRPSDHNRVIVHRVESIINEDPKTIRTKGDANPGSIPGTDFPITEKEYLGKTIAKVPQVGYILQFVQPPVNYILIAIVIGIMIVKQMTKKKNVKDNLILEQDESEDQEISTELSDIDKIEKDSEYSEHVNESEITDEKTMELDKNNDSKKDKKTSKKDDKK